jgi:hypothetical protein
MKSKVVAIISITLVGVMLALPAASHAWRGGWGWGQGAFVGGALLGASITAPYYAYPPPAYPYPPPQVIYTAPPPTYTYPGQPAAAQAVPSPQVQGKGHWVEVPGRMVSNMWVPPHKVWVPDNSPGNSMKQPTGNQPASDSHSGTGERS